MGCKKTCEDIIESTLNSVHQTRANELNIKIKDLRDMYEKQYAVLSGLARTSATMSDILKKFKPLDSNVI